jgi:hypothetical protein
MALRIPLPGALSPGVFDSRRLAGGLLSQTGSVEGLRAVKEYVLADHSPGGEREQGGPVVVERRSHQERDSTRNAQEQALLQPTARARGNGYWLAHNLPVRIGGRRA